MEVRVLGTVRAFADTGADLGARGPAACTVLAILALSAGRTVPRSRLISALWDDDPPQTVDKALQVNVSRLRQTLEPGTTPERSVIVTDGDGYRLDVKPTATDWGRFTVAIADHDWSQALAMWEGEPLGGCVESAIVEGERVRLGEALLGAVAEWARHAISAGRGETAASELERHLATHPLDERLWACLAAAYAASGRQADALRSVQRARHHLVEAGLEPGIELRRAERQVLQHASVPAGPIVGLPAARSELIGRDGDRRAVADMLGRHRFVTITGSGGVGKTALAIEAARDAGGGVVTIFVDLAPARDRDDVLTAIAIAAGLTGIDRAAADSIGGALAAQPALVVLDNCEHVLSDCAPIVDSLLDAAEHLRILCTSRAVLALKGERVWPLGPLASGDAVELYRERADARRPGAGSSAAPEEVAALCDRLDRLPLAIELAAARADRHPPAQIAELLFAGDEPLRGADDRHRSLDRAIAWSYALLDPACQRALRVLSVFHSPVDRAVCDRLGLRSEVDRLIDHSLLAVDLGAGEATYRILDTVRAFARRELERRDEAHDARSAHADVFLAQASDEAEGTTFLSFARATAIGGRLADFVAALDHLRDCDRLDAEAQLAVYAAALMWCPGSQAPIEDRLGSLLDRSFDLDGERRASLYFVAGMSALMKKDVPAIGHRFVEAFKLAVEHPGGLGAAALLMEPGLRLAGGSEAATVVPTIDRVRSRLRADVADLARQYDAFLPLTRGDVGTAVDLAERAHGDHPWDLFDSLSGFSFHAVALYLSGRHHDVLRRLDEARQLSGDVHLPFLLVAALEACAIAAAGDPAGARARLRDSVERRFFLVGVRGDVLIALAEIARLEGDEARATELLSTPFPIERHWSTGILRAFTAARLGIPQLAMDYTFRFEHERVEALIEAEFSR